MKLFSTSALFLLVGCNTDVIIHNRSRRHPHEHHHAEVQPISPAIRAAIAQMDPFSLTLEEVFVLGKVLRKGAPTLSQNRLTTAFQHMKPNDSELHAFYDLQQRLLQKAGDMHEGRLAILGLTKDTVADSSFFSDEARYYALRKEAAIQQTLDRDLEQKIAHEHPSLEGGAFLKSGQEPSRKVQETKGLEYFLDVRNMSFDQQWKLAEWMKLHPTANLSQRRFNNVLSRTRAPTVTELNHFHNLQQQALKGELDTPWIRRLMSTMWRNLTPDPDF